MGQAIEGVAPETHGRGSMDGEGPVEHVRNALQIVNGLSYLMAAQRMRSASGDAEGDRILAESLRALERRLGEALTQLVGSSPPASRHRATAALG